MEGMSMFHEPQTFPHVTGFALCTNPHLLMPLRLPEDTGTVSSIGEALHHVPCRFVPLPNGYSRGHTPTCAGDELIHVSMARVAGPFPYFLDYL